MSKLKNSLEYQDGELKGIIRIEAKDFVKLHNYFAEILNAGCELSKIGDSMGKKITMEECAGRLLVVTMAQMEKFAESNPELMEELLISHNLENSNERHCDMMYG